ncbi:MAG: hypothetical protein WAW90_03100 [Minisyncoccia bacterium]
MTTRLLTSFFSKRFRSFAHRDPGRDWLLLLTASTILLASIIVWNEWVFSTVANGGVIGTPQTKVAPIFSQSSLDTVHTIFEKRAAFEANYVSGAARFADPSQ